MMFNPEFSDYEDIIPADWAVVNSSPNVTFISTICKVELDQQVPFSWNHKKSTAVSFPGWSRMRVLVISPSDPRK